MKILMLTPYLPYPLWSGGQIRTYNLLKHLSKKHQITLFSFIREEDEKQHIIQLKKYCHQVNVFVKRPPWSLTSLILAAVTYYPLVVCMYLNKNVMRHIAESIAHTHFDLIHAETFYVMPNIKTDKIPIILAEQTIEYLVYRHFTHSVRFLPKKLLMEWDVSKIYFWEKRFWKRAVRVVAMSKSDKNVMLKRTKNLTVDLVPNGVDTKFFALRPIPENSRKKIVLFVGNFKWLQNREAVSILVEQIWPEIKSKIPQAKLWIVGKFPTEDIMNYQSSSIMVSNDVDDIRQAYRKSDVLLAPIFGPGGTRYKILESMATGIPVVTTSTGIEGLSARHGVDALVADDIRSLAWETVRVLSDRSLYQRLVLNGRKLVEKQFSWEAIADTLDSIYMEARRE